MAWGCRFVVLMMCVKSAVCLIPPFFLFYFCVQFLLEISSVLADNATFTTVEAGLQSAFAISTQVGVMMFWDCC